jgi:hypothetical protein
LVLLFGGLLVLPIWLVAYPPLLDYPNHLARSFVLSHLHDPAYRFSQFYSADWGFYPYLLMDVSLIGLQKFLPAEQAGRVFLTFCVLAVPLASWFFLRQANPGEDHAALWALLNAHNLFFLYGFLSFYLSLAALFLALGLWLRSLERPRPAAWVLAFLAFTALYFSHLVGLAITGVVVAAYCVVTRRKLGEMALSGLLFVPGAFFYLYASRVGLGGAGGATFRSFGEKAEALWDLLHGYSTRLDWITLLALAGYFLMAWWRNRDFRWNIRWLGVAACLLGVYWVLPWGYGEGWDLDIRVLPVLFVVLLATAKVGKRGWWLAPIAVLLFTLRAANVAQSFAAAQAELAGLAQSFSVTSPNARVLPIVEADEDDPILHPYAHFWAHGVIQRGWFSPYLFTTKGVLPLAIREDAYSPDGFWDLAYDKPPDWQQVQEDYDYIWAYNVDKFSPQLELIGDLIYEDGRLQVFRLKKPEKNHPR